MQQQRNTFIATTDGDKIYAINSISQDRTEVGITQKAAKELQDALANIIVERDELYEKCVAAGIIEKPKTTEDVAKAALEEAKAAREENAKIMALLLNIQEKLDGQQTATDKRQPKTKEGA